MGAYSYQQNPENEYLLIHAVPAWECLDLIWGRDPHRRKEMAEAINTVFDQACAAPTGKSGDLDCSDLSFPDPVLVDPFASVRASNGDGSSAKRRRSH